MCSALDRAVGGTSKVLPTVALADSGRPSAFSNCATLLQPLTAELAPTTLAEIEAFFAFDDPTRHGEVILISAWPTGDLRPYGWTLAGHPPLHLLPTGAVPNPPPAELRVEEVRNLAGLHAWERVAIEGFPLEGIQDAGQGSLVNLRWLEEPRGQQWVGWVDERPVAASAVWVDHGINNVALVATMPDARRRGYGEALIWRAALVDPSLPAMLFSSDDGRPVYDRMGFLPLWRLTFWYRDRPGVSIR
jgi:GNAT superfamily N-acetyltransferase